MKQTGNPLTFFAQCTVRDSGLCLYKLEKRKTNVLVFMLVQHFLRLPRYCGVYCLKTFGSRFGVIKQ